MKFLKPNMVKGIIGAFEDGKIFSVVFQKADGTLRRMVCRTGVTKHLKGGEANYAGPQDENIGVFDTEANAYRCFSSCRVVRIKGDGVTVEACTPDEIEAPIHNASGEVVKVK